MKELAAWTLAIALLATCAQAQAPSETAAPADDIWAAAAKGDIEAIKRHLSVAANVKTEGESGVTPLLVAALFGRTEAAKLLIERGADVKIANGEDGATALHAAAFFCHTDIVELLLNKGADINALNQRSETPLDAVAGPWSEGLGELYTGIAKAVGMEVDLKRIEVARPAMAALLRERGGKTGPKPAAASPAENPGGNVADVAARGLRCSYYMNGRIYVNVLGTPEGKPVTVPPGEGWEDFKPSWSKTGDMLVFFRRVKNAPDVSNWKTVLCVIKTDGTGLQELTDDTHTNFNPTWTRDGTNRPIWNRKNPETGGYFVMWSKVGAKPGQEVAISDRRYHTWVHTCLADGRILVESAHPEQGWGYYLMTPKPGGEPRFERIDCGGLEKQGLLCRISVSPSEKRICFSHLLGHRFREPGHAIFIADFDAQKRTITNARLIANQERKNIWYSYPRWVKDESAVVYHSYETGKGALYLYTLEDGATTRVSTNPQADYRYPHGEATPK
ncbi:MAG TPA: ankyrin repeat domain-containing protein [Thermoguttaceae bacterium]|nr:ankyrin repeat domain-containing protein [Thermoguttaceae bacterium]HUU90535.1 ankyrin repeat domain-containing protein [Phycisphaerae bacterium]